MKNFKLENAELKTLSTEEMNEIDGGFWWIIGLTLAVLNTDWDKAGKDFSDGFNGKQVIYITLKFCVEYSTT